MGTPRPETHRRALVAPAFSSDPAITGLVGETTADDAIANLDGRVTALEGAGAPDLNFTATHVIADGAADYDFLFAGAPASLPKSAKFFNATGGAYGNCSLDVIGGEVWGTFTGVNFSRPVTVTGGIVRINGGLRFKTGAVWSLNGGAGEVDPFSGQNLTIAASF